MSNKLTVTQCRIPVLQTLVELGGCGKATEVITLVRQKIQHLITPADNETDKLGCPRWQKTVSSARHFLKHANLISDDLKQGIWEITDKGRVWLKSKEIAILRIKDPHYYLRVSSAVYTS